MSRQRARTAEPFERRRAGIPSYGAPAGRRRAPKATGEPRAGFSTPITEILDQTTGVLTSDVCRSFGAATFVALAEKPLMPKRIADRLSRREREIMNAVFALRNRAFAEDIRQRLTNPPSHSAVRVMLARLEKKGHLQTFFGGSLRDMMASLVRDESWANEDLDALRGEIDRVRKQRRQS